MKKILFLFLAGSFFLSSCEKDWLDVQPQTILTDEQTWNDPKIVVTVLANFYSRIPAHYSLTAGWQAMSEYDEAMWSGFSNDEWRNNIPTYGYERWRLWDYGFIRDIQVAIDGIDGSATLTTDQKTQFLAELRFLRAFDYFEMVKRMGGVPLVSTQLKYDFSGDPSYLQLPRSKESEAYDFIAKEVDSIKNDIGNTGSNTRANKYTALALKCRAMLYAGSLAKYNSQMSTPITLPGGEVGIPASMATGYYTAALEAAQEIITTGGYSLYNTNPNKGENFYEALAKKAGNNEVIWAQDFAQGNLHFFTYDNIARSLREDNLGSSAIAPSLNLVEDFEYLDGSNGALKTRTPDGSDYIYYDNASDIFANKDARLYGTIIYPGTSFRNQMVSIQAGVKVWNSATSSYQTIESDQFGSIYGGTSYPNGDRGLLTGADGPHRTQQDISNTGFYLRKYIDADPGASKRTQLSDMWWVRFRLGEIYLNAAEAAFELGNTQTALQYINLVRERAGFPANSLKALTMEALQHERRVELAFEDHRVWDLKRWRIADKVWNGQNNGYSVVYALYPYRVVRPGDSRNNKYVFEKIIAPRFRSPHNFRLGNYYSSIDQGVLNNNPKIVRNPFH